MKLLAVETSTLSGSIAVVENSQIVVELTLQVEETHSAQLLPAIEHVLAAAGLTPFDCDGFAVAAGPGSFTGLRIGMAAVKGLAVAASKPLIAIPTLEAMAGAFPFSKYTLCPMIDARMKEIYGALFRTEDGAVTRLSEDVALPPKTLLERINEKTIFFGSGAIRYRREILETLGDRALFPLEEIMGARASMVGLLAAKRMREGDVDDLAAVEPLYIREAKAIARKPRLK